MWFKNIQAYRLPSSWSMTAEKLGEMLKAQSFTPASSNELMRSGFASPRENDLMVHEVHGQWLIKFQMEKKLLPSSVVNQVAKARADELEEQQGFRPGRKAMKELKERVADELLPRAFAIRRATWAWIDPVNGWLVVDAASASGADDVVKALLKCVDRMPLESVRVAHSPSRMMTAWLEHDEAPHGFTIDQDAILRSTGESRAAVRYEKHTLEVDDIRRHIKAGKQCTRLAMTWNDRVSFVLTESLAIKGVKALDVLTENEKSVRDDAERFDNDMVMMTGELAKMLGDIMLALGGEAADLVSPARGPVASLAGADEGDGGEDDLYDTAAQVVVKNQRASISLVQRHLRIGYNRAARLLEAMEVRGLVSAMQSNGNRDVLLRAA